MIKIGMMIGDRYEILEKIGTGGMSDVYKAKDHKLNRAVAIKILKQEFSENENFVSKFRVEAQAAAGLMHANIVNVYDVGEERDVYYIVMELVEGITLKKYIEKKARLSVKEAVSIAIQVSLGIEAAHNNHIIHRDIKPQNIMISKEGRVKVTDFGIAKAATSNTITSNVMGSVHYTSPEQARGGYSDAKSDIYSLGITLFEMLTGRVPFNGDTTVAIAIKHIQEPMPSPRDFVPEIPISVEQIVLKCTQKSPDARYQSMESLIEDLKRSLITPDENFVVMNGVNVDGETRMLKDRENLTKKQTGRLNPVKPEPMRLNENAAREKQPKQRERERERTNTAVRSAADKPKTKNRQTPSSARAKEDVEDYNPTMERITTAIMVIVAVVIGCVVVYIVGNVLGVFPIGGEDGDVSGTPIPTQEAVTPTPAILPEGSRAEVPDVSSGGAFSQAEATKMLEERGFRVSIERSTSSTVLKGYVISQTPTAGESVSFGATVTLLISDGADTSTVTVPQVLGYTQEAAQEALSAVGLKVGAAEEGYSDEYPIGQVYYQSYAPGGNVTEGTAVDLKISIGPKPRTYACNIQVEAPMDPEYSGGEANVMLIGSDNNIYYNATTNVFPIFINVSRISNVPEGYVVVTYVVSVTTTTTDEAGNVVTGVTEEVRSEQYPVPFTEEE
ncbi:MAG: Stk1 family PASTA domain-containing Ser/Thr kinase [bacterium]|nr:Stk1 family PASTA domain-containing Ser/Thr kinase [bacterium]